MDEKQLNLLVSRHDGQVFLLRAALAEAEGALRLFVEGNKTHTEDQRLAVGRNALDEVRRALRR